MTCYLSTILYVRFPLPFRSATPLPQFLAPWKSCLSWPFSSLLNQPEGALTICKKIILQNMVVCLQAISHLKITIPNQCKCNISVGFLVYSFLEIFPIYNWFVYSVLQNGLIFKSDFSASNNLIFICI